MENAFSRQGRQQTPESAVVELLNATRQLASLALDNPIDFWMSKAKD